MLEMYLTSITMSTTIWRMSYGEEQNKISQKNKTRVGSGMARQDRPTRELTASNDCSDGWSVVEGGAWHEDTAAADGHHVTGCASRNARILQQQRPSRARRGAARRLHHLHTMNGTGAALHTPRLRFYQSSVYGDLVQRVLLAHH